MDTAGSITQPRDVRSYPRTYDQFFESPSEGLVPTQSCGLPQGSSSNPFAPTGGSEGGVTQPHVDLEPHTLRDDDIGAVNFNSMPLPRPLLEHADAKSQPDRIQVDNNPQVSQYGNIMYFDGVNKPTDDVHVPDEPVTDEADTHPETPVPVNPFANKALARPALATSQLFQQTQATPALKLFQASPTSSRPSPTIQELNNMSPNVNFDIASSPLRDRQMLSEVQAISSPLVPISLRKLSTVRPRRMSALKFMALDDDAVPSSPGNNFPRAIEHSGLNHRSESRCENLVEGLAEHDDPTAQEKPVQQMPTAVDEGKENIYKRTRPTPLKTYSKAASRVERIAPPKPRKNTARARKSAPQPAPVIPTHDDSPEVPASAPALEHTASTAPAAPQPSECGTVVENSQPRSNPKRKTRSNRVSTSLSRTHHGRAQCEVLAVEETPPSTKEVVRSSARSSERVPETSPAPAPEPRTISRSPSLPPRSGQSALGTAENSGEPDLGLATDTPVVDSPAQLSAEGGAANIPPDSSDIPLARTRRAAATAAAAAFQRRPLPNGRVKKTEIEKNPPKEPLSSDRPVCAAQSPESSISTLTEFTHSPRLTPSTVEAIVSSPKASSITSKSNNSSASPASVSTAPIQQPSGRLVAKVARQWGRGKKARPSGSGSPDELSLSTPPFACTSVPTSCALTKQSVKQPTIAALRSGFKRSSLTASKRGSILSDVSVLSDTAAQTLFQGMAFAISFRSKKPGESERSYAQRTKESEQLSKAIMRHGGYILSEGFDELFEVPALHCLDSSRDPTPVVTPVKKSKQSRASINHDVRVQPQPVSSGVKLKESAKHYGFVALIADGHSRKVKYMQALALGLPCISDRWITACIKKGAILPWSTYLLCAGNSAILGDAVRSRQLEPYSAEDSSLPLVIEERSRLLDGQSILLVMRKSHKKKEEQKKAYLFLAQVLGATLTRADSTDQAKAMIREREAAGCPYDWVYFGDVNGNGGAEEGLISCLAESTPLSPSKSRAVAGGNRPTRKRKRDSAVVVSEAASLVNVSTVTADTSLVGGGDDGRPAKRVKVLCDEIVVQSLILGRLVDDEEEMELCKGVS